MSGLFSTIFDGNDADGGASESHSGEHIVDGGTDLHADPSITLSATTGGTYETPDGTMHSWERTDSVTLDTDTQIVTSVSAVLTHDGDSDSLVG